MFSRILLSKGLKSLTFASLLMSAGAASALSIPIDCAGQNVGTVTVNLLAGGQISGAFAAAPAFVTLAAAAAACHQDHWNWYQVVLSDTNPPNDANGVPLVPPYVDPPPGGYGAPGLLWADNLPGYYNEVVPNPLPPGYVPGLQLAANTDTGNLATATVLNYYDAPADPKPTTIQFKTWLASENADGTIDRLMYPDFIWTWSNVSGVNVTSDLRTPEPTSIPLVLMGIVLTLFMGRGHRKAA